MKTYIMIWVALLILIVAGAAVTAAVGAEGFLQYTFVPRWRHQGRWRGPGPWPWRYPSGPRWWYVPYVEPFEDGMEEKKDEKGVGNGAMERPIDKVEGAPEAFDSVPAPELQKMLRTTGLMGDSSLPPLTGTVSPVGKAGEGFVNGSGYPNGMHVPPAVRYSIFSGSEVPASYGEDGTRLAASRKPMKDDVMAFPPGAPASTEGLFDTRAPSYLLLGDELEAEPGAGAPSKISCVNSRSCYATDFDRLLEQGGNFRQITNNFKRGYPDSCSSLQQELVLSFYKSNGPRIDVPKNCA